MKLVIMTKATFFVEEDKILTTFFEEGLESLHLYKPGSEPVYSERLLTLLNDDYHKKITVHDHFYLYDEFGLRGIHLDTMADAVPDGYRGRVTRTCNTLDDLREAKRTADYVLLRTVFDSLSDATDTHSFTDEALHTAARQGLIDRKVYALGGVSLDNIRQARDLGFGGVVVCGDLWNRFNIHQQQDYRELIAHFQKLQKAAG